jgi:hypothetical protein
VTRRHGRLNPDGSTREERRRDRWLRVAGTVIACAILGPPFVVVFWVAVRGLR